MKLGGIGSDIYPAGRKGEYWTVTDRGPNGQIKVDGKKRRTFPVPGFDPAIDAIPLTTSSGKAVTGLPDQQSRDEAQYTYDAKTPLSRTTRLLRFSPREKAVTAEYAYRFDPVNVVDPSEDDTSELKISSVVAVAGDRLLVEERTDKAARLQLVRLERRSNILGGPWDDETTAPSLEQLDDPATAGVPVPAKRLVLDLNRVDGVQQKIEGIARVDHDTLALINDNDFGMTDGAGAFDAQGRLVDSGIRTTVVYVRLPEGL